MRTPKAFSVVELLVVIAIFGLISTVILANHQKFNSSVLLGNVAYDVALSVRQAQVYGLSTRQYSNQFRIGYGIRFQGGSTYSFFADNNKNKRYDAGTDSIIQTYSFGQGHSLKQFCGVKSDGTQSCSDGASPITFLDIVFLRPEPDASILADTQTVYSSATITVQSGSGETRMVTVQSTGQISVVPEQNNTNNNQCNASNVCNSQGTAVINSCTDQVIQTCQYGCTANACNSCTPTNICSSGNVVNSCTGALVQSCSNGCTNGSCNACTPTYSCNNGYQWINSCTGGVAKTCADSCGAAYPLCVKAGGGCFSPETAITMADGTTRPIVDIRVGDTVRSRTDDGSWVDGAVTETFVHENKETLIVNGKLIVTPIHPLLTLRGWVDAGEIVVGDTLVMEQGTEEVLTIEPGQVLPKVYNLEVEPAHTYVAGGVVVHNKIQQ